MNTIDNEFKIQSAESYLATMRMLNEKNRPPAVLRLLMNAFESYRQAHKIGWSRPWNKYGVKTFRSYRLDLGQDTDLIAFAVDILQEAGSEMPEAARVYVKDLLDEGPEARGRLMGFIFFHDIEDGAQVYEGATLSFGRKIKKRHRDRLDFVFEAPVRDGRAGSFTRMRIFVDPFQGGKAPLWETECCADSLPAAQAAFQRLYGVGVGRGQALGPLDVGLYRSLRAAAALCGKQQFPGFQAGIRAIIAGGRGPMIADDGFRFI